MSRVERRSRTRPLDQAGYLRTAVREPLILIIEDQPVWSLAIEQLCDFLDVKLERLGECSELPLALRDRRPMAVLSEMESASVDGCDVLKMVGAHDPDLPVMVRTDADPVLRGAGEAIQGIVGLSNALFVDDLPAAGELVEFLFRAGQRGRCLGLMPA